MPVKPAVSGRLWGRGLLKALSSAWEQPRATPPWDQLPGKGTPPFLASLQEAGARGSCLRTWCPGGHAVVGAA